MPATSKGCVRANCFDHGSDFSFVCCSSQIVFSMLAVTFTQFLVKAVSVAACRLEKVFDCGAPDVVRFLLENIEYSYHHTS
jgi:hypothetical protein